jgi:pimeloyl-ACP methyl ester carboxylesterase
MSYPEMANDLGNFIKTIVVDKDKAESITVMGHSMGGKTGILFFYYFFLLKILT